MIQLGDIGDVVLTTPCIRALRENFPESRIVVAVKEKAAELLEDCPWLDHLAVVAKSSRTFWEELRYQLGFFRDLRCHRCELAVDLRTGTRGAMLGLLSGAKQRIGFYAEDGKLWRNRVFAPLLHREYSPDEHVVDYLLCLLESFGISPVGRTPELSVSKTRSEEITRLLREQGVENGCFLVAVQPFSLWGYKEWASENISSLIRWLIDEKMAIAIVTGAEHEHDRAQGIVDSCGVVGCYNLAGKTSIAMYAALLKKCDLFFGVDSLGSI
ncbi:MAG: glycosyltransferase family 9 protein [Proteobacteria bacterium]|nr:glycosyltransferase family 9 protein [Pseudomonadota bacterium]MBU1739806.1 glycosyltransferase family 9 protein [Pseudomonadota bacterium]